MTVSQGSCGQATWPIDATRTAAMRMMLASEMAGLAVEFGKHALALATLADTSDDMTARDRAMAALDMFLAKSAIEEIDDALARIDMAFAAVNPSARLSPIGEVT